MIPASVVDLDSSRLVLPIWIRIPGAHYIFDAVYNTATDVGIKEIPPDVPLESLGYAAAKCTHSGKCTHITFSYSLGVKCS